MSVAAGASTLGGVYRNLTGDTADPFPFFKQLMDTAFPGTSTITSDNLDNPFPLGIQSLALVVFLREETVRHGLPAPNTEGPFAINLFMQPGSVPKPDLVSDIKRGIWVTRFWYVRIVHPKLSIITGMTRDGTFLIENGKVTRPVKDLRFTQSMLEALDGTLAVGNTTKLEIGEFIGASRVPAVRLKAFTFTS